MSADEEQRRHAVGPGEPGPDRRRTTRPRRRRVKVRLGVAGRRREAARSRARPPLRALVARDEEVDAPSSPARCEAGGPDRGGRTAVEKGANGRFGEFEQADDDEGADAQRSQDLDLLSAVGMAGVGRRGRPAETEQGENVGRGVEIGMERVRPEGERAGRRSRSPAFAKAPRRRSGPASARKTRRIGVGARRRRRAASRGSSAEQQSPCAENEAMVAFSHFGSAMGSPSRSRSSTGASLPSGSASVFLSPTTTIASAGRSRYLRATRRTSSLVTAAIFAV